tara:strand:- start:418 stop:2040 length:1623 start_codon:yes stop_codon:yes gene_type:complete
MILKEQQTIKTIMSTVNEMTLKEKYLINPVFDFVNDSKLMKSHKNHVKIFRATTGFGKSHFIVNTFTPFLGREHDIRFVLFCAPNTEALCHREFETMTADDVNFYFAGNDIHKAEWALEKWPQKTIIMSASHQRNLVVGNNFKRISEVIKNYKSAVIIDEIHTWAVPSAELYEPTMGSKNEKFKAKLWKALSLWMESTPFVFGCTATINRVMKGEFEDFFGKHFHVINEWCPKEKMIFKQAWLGKTKIYDKNDWMTQHKSMKEFIKNRIDQENLIKSLGKKYGYETESKMVSIIQVQTHTKKATATWEDIARKIETELENTEWRRYGNFPQIMVMTGDKGGKGKWYKGKVVEKLSDQQVIDECIEQNNKIRFLIVVNKGTTGINIPNLGGIFGYRPRNTIDRKDKIELTEFARQFFGRCVRIFTGMKNTVLYSDRHGYGLETFLETASEGQRKILLAANSYDLYVPDTAMFTKALADWSTEYANSIESAELALFPREDTELTKIKTVEVHECEDGVECPTCGKPGFLPNLEDVFEKVLLN